MKSVCIWSSSGLYFPGFWTEYEEIHKISPYSVRMWENADQKNFEYGQFSRSILFSLEHYNQ